MTGGPGGDWDAIEEALEGLPVARLQVDPRDAEVERLRAELGQLRDRVAQAEAYQTTYERAQNDAYKVLAERDSARAELSDLYPAIESLRDELKRAKALLDPDNEDAVEIMMDVLEKRWTSYGVSPFAGDDGGNAGDAEADCKALLAALREAAS